MSQPRELPILFQGAMVRAIFNGKEQTRRSSKLERFAERGRFLHMGEQGGRYGAFFGDSIPHDPVPIFVPCPYGRPGDRLWVKETWRTAKSLDRLSPKQIEEQSQAAGNKVPPFAPIFYLADGVSAPGVHPRGWTGWGKVRVSIHMPRWASRITLEVTGVTVDRGPISQADAWREGFSNPEEFAELFETLNGPGTLNRWRWAVSFRRLSSPVLRGAS